jgi:hypothetical protein
VLEGDLTDFTLPDVLRLLAATGKTGRLTVDDGARRGRLDLRDGHVRDVSADLSRLPLARRLLGARLITPETLREVLAAGDELPSDVQFARRLVDAGVADHGTVASLLAEQTTDATFDLLRWSTGAFRFVGLDVGGPADDLEPVLDVGLLLDEVAARLDAWPRLIDDSGATDAVVTLGCPERSGAHQLEVTLGAPAWELLTLVDGRRTISELVDLAGQGEFATRRTLTELRAQGIVTIGAPGEPGPVAQRVADHAVLVELERDLAARTSPRSTRPSPASEPEAPAATSPAVSSVPDPVEEPVAAVPPPSTEAVHLPPPVDPTPASAPTLPRATPAAAPRPAATVPVPALAGQVRPLRTTVRGERLRTDPDLDEALVTRLIEGVEAL